MASVNGRNKSEGLYSRFVYDALYLLVNDPKLKHYQVNPGVWQKLRTEGLIDYPPPQFKVKVTPKGIEALAMRPRVR